MLAVPLCALCVLAGVVLGELRVAAPQGPVRSATLEVRRVRDYLPRRLTATVGTATALLLVVLALTTATGSADDLGRAGRSFARRCSAVTGGATGPWPGSFYALPLGAVVVMGLVLAGFALRRVVRRPRQGEDAIVDDALRRQAAEAVVAACGLLVALPFAGVSLLTAAALHNHVCPPAGSWFRRGRPAGTGAGARGARRLVRGCPGGTGRQRASRPGPGRGTAVTAPPPLRVDTTDPTPPYEQLRRQFVELIGSGVLGHGDRLPPLRQLAADLGLAVGTVARTYRELETAGLVASPAGRRHAGAGERAPEHGRPAGARPTRARCRLRAAGTAAGRQRRRRAGRPRRRRCPLSAVGDRRAERQAPRTAVQTVHRSCSTIGPAGSRRRSSPVRWPSSVSLSSCRIDRPVRAPISAR